MGIQLDFKTPEIISTPISKLQEQRFFKYQLNGGGYGLGIKLSGTVWFTHSGDGSMWRIADHHKALEGVVYLKNLLIVEQHVVKQDECL